MRFSLRAVLVLVAFVAAFFAGRASLLPVIREHERQDVLQNQQIQALEKAKTYSEMAEVARRRRLSQEELRHLDSMIELERTRSVERLDRPRYLAPDFVPPKLP